MLRRTDDEAERSTRAPCGVMSKAPTWKTTTTAAKVCGSSLIHPPVVNVLLVKSKSRDVFTVAKKEITETSVVRRFLTEYSLVRNFLHASTYALATGTHQYVDEEPPLDRPACGLKDRSTERAFLLRKGFVVLRSAICAGRSDRSILIGPASLQASHVVDHDQPVGNVLILDHLNINHEKGRHDWLKAFYFDLLRCVVDPRKHENLEKVRKTLWANVGPFQFHLPEGTPEAQVLEGVVTLVYPDLQSIHDRARTSDISSKLHGSRFDLKLGKDRDELVVSDPRGTKFRIVRGDEAESDRRGRQPGDPSEGLGMRDLTIYAPSNCNVPGIARFYETVLRAPVLAVDPDRCVVSVGTQQTLTFQAHPDRKPEVRHEDLRDDCTDPPSGRPTFFGNYGPHVSMYVADLASTYERADSVGMVYVNPRFKRQAYTLEEAIDDCMFRCLDIVDPLEPNDVIVRLEHEIRSVVNRDGSKYRSCPFDAIPDVRLK